MKKSKRRCSCACQARGRVAPGCRLGIYGTPTEWGWDYAPLACALDAGRLSTPRKPVSPENYKRDRRCINPTCNRPISDLSRGLCVACQNAVNGRKSKGGPRNPRWGWPPKARERGKA